MLKTFKKPLLIQSFLNLFKQIVLVCIFYVGNSV